MTRTASLLAMLALATQPDQYNADVPKTILELQQFRQASSLKFRARTGAEGTATLVNLNPAIHAWYLLGVAWKDGPAGLPWHLQNPRPHETRVFLDDKFPSGLTIATGNDRYSCDLFGAGATDNPLEQGRKSPLIYYPLCGGRLYLRNPAKGQRTALESATEFLRDQVWGGEKVIVMFHHLLADRYRETAVTPTTNATRAASGNGATAGQPLPALTDPAFEARLIQSENLGIALEPPGLGSGMKPGGWYPAAGNAGAWVSVMQPNFIAPVIMQKNKDLAGNLDSVEASSLCYLIAFDLGRFEVAYSRGTDYPGVGWSDRVTAKMKNPALPGPDGIGTVAPLISTGLISPEDGRRTVATFTGGFKRSHGAFRYGDLSLKNHGSHYGFIENGVVFSKLQPGLATILMLNDGSLEMKTWTEADDRRLAQIRYARQNGVPLAEFDPASQTTLPGRLVRQWGPGNWSGSEDDRLRTIRGGAALQDGGGGRRFLIYAVFSDATPSAMARVFQAYRCSYAMLLDMNALEHTYLAYYRRSGSEMLVDHLIKGMSQLDQSVAGQVIPRFLGYPDNRDFFYVMQRNSKEVKR